MDGVPSMGRRMIRQVFGRSRTAARNRRPRGPAGPAGTVSRICGYDLFELSQRIAFLSLYQGVEQPSEVGEVVVDDGPRDAGDARHGLDRDAGVALFDDESQGSVEQLLPPLLRRQPGRIRPSSPNLLRLV